MPYFRVEIKRAGQWALLHGKVETRDAAAAIEYVKAVLPKRCAGHELRATPLVRANHVMTQQRAEA
jgi:hypothetical protein